MDIVKISPELLAMVGSQANANTLLPFSREIFLLDIVVAGTSFCEEIDNIEPKLIPETVLKMRRDPKNEYDEQAIAIYFESVRIGWVPQEMNEIISRLMDAGKAFFCRVTSAYRKGTWLRIKAKIFMVE